MKKYYDKKSLWSKVLNFSFKFTNAKKNSDTVEGAKKYIEKLSKKDKNKNLPEKLGLTKQVINNIDVYCYLGSIDDNRKKILYIHGGSYIEEANYFQLNFAMKIAEKTNSTLIIPIYPLAPKGTYKNMYQLIDNLYSKILESNTEINFLGDSAGGGFILSFAMYLRDKKIKLPKNIIMMSPWLDVSLSNPNTYEDAKKDYMCGVDGTRYCGKLWAGDLDMKDPLISPMFGNVNDLSKMTIITGGSEVLNSDCHKFSDILTTNKVEHNFIEYKGQGHDFGAYPTKEGKLVIEDISRIINQG